MFSSLEAEYEYSVLTAGKRDNRKRDNGETATDVVAVSLAHAPVSLVGVHHGGEVVLLAADNINGGPVCLGVERLCNLVAAVIMKIG